MIPDIFFDGGSLMR